MFKFLIKFNLLALGLLSPLVSHANGGVITGGGGGITIPEHVATYSVKTAAFENAGKILIPWFRKEEMNFNFLKDEDKQASPFRKIFQSDKSIYSLIHDSSIEIRENAPCLDVEGLPHDGSIFAEKPHAICLSAFLMAPKLSYYNVDAETLALAAHEYSHLMGTNEDEAVAIQKSAISAFMTTGFGDVTGKVAKLSLNFMSTDYSGPRTYVNALYSFRQFISRSQESLSQDEIRQIRERVELILKSIMTENLRLLFVPENLADQSDLQFARFIVGGMALCALDKTLPKEMSASCQKDLDGIFHGKCRITFREFSIALTDENLCMNAPDFCFAGNKYDQLIVRPQSVDEIRKQFRDLDVYLGSLALYVRDLVYCGGSSGLKNCDGAPALRILQ